MHVISRQTFRPLLSSAGALVAAILFTAGTPQAAAQDKPPVSVTLEAKVVKKDAEGKETLASAEKASPGEVVEYVAVCKNNTDHTITNLKPTIPIPQGTDYLPGTATPSDAEASTLKESFKAIPLQREEKQADGTLKSVPVPAAEYRSLRWTLAEVKSGQTVKVSVRVRVQLTKPVPAPSPVPAGS